MNTSFFIKQIETLQKELIAGIDTHPPSKLDAEFDDQGEEPNKELDQNQQTLSQLLDCFRLYKGEKLIDELQTVIAMNRSSNKLEDEFSCKIDELCKDIQREITSVRKINYCLLLMGADNIEEFQTVIAMHRSSNKLDDEFSRKIDELCKDIQTEIESVKKANCFMAIIRSHGDAEGIIEKLTTFIDSSNYDVNQVDEQGHSALYYAVRENSVEIAKFLQQKGAQLCVDNLADQEILLMATPEMTNELLSGEFLHGNFIRDELGENLLDKAIRDQHWGLVKVLLLKINQLPLDRQKEILSKVKFEVKSTNKEKPESIIISFETACDYAIHLLETRELACGTAAALFASENTQLQRVAMSSHDKEKRLLKAVILGDLKVVEDILADSNVKVDATDERGRTALMLAVKRAGRTTRATKENAEEIVRKLLKAGADTTREDYNGNTAMGIAYSEECSLKLKKMLELVNNVQTLKGLDFVNALVGLRSHVETHLSTLETSEEFDPLYKTAVTKLGKINREKQIYELARHAKALITHVQQYILLVAINNAKDYDEAAFQHIRSSFQSSLNLFQEQMAVLLVPNEPNYKVFFSLITTIMREAMKVGLIATGSKLYKHGMTLFKLPEDLRKDVDTLTDSMEKVEKMLDSVNQTSTKGG